MRSILIERALMLALGCILLCSGCILSPEEDPAPPKQEEIYKDLADKENVLYNLVQAYRYTNIDKYSELLHENYIWYNQASDFQSGKVDKEFFDRAEDISRTTGIFLAKNNRHPEQKVIDELELSLQYASWQRVSEIGGNPCEDCWETTRPYYIKVVTENMSKTIIGDDLVKFTVVSAERDGKKIYLLYRADDLKK